MVGNRGTDGWDLDSDRVDEDMIVLRKRIREIRITDESISEPSGWTEWEKEYYLTAYSSDVCEVIGLLQRFLMNTRPSLAFGTILLVLISVPTSFGFLLHRLFVMSGSVLAALHINWLGWYIIEESKMNWMSITEKMRKKNWRRGVTVIMKCVSWPLGELDELRIIAAATKNQSIFDRNCR
jgi:hypothetical protein